MVSQSSTIAFFLIAGFVIYVTMKGELPDYAGVLGIGPKSKRSTLSATIDNTSSALADSYTYGSGG